MKPYTDFMNVLNVIECWYLYLLWSN